MTSARMASTFVVGAFGAAFLLAQSGTGQAQLLPRSELVTAKSQPGDDGARRAPLDSGVSNDLDCANPPAWSRLMGKPRHDGGGQDGHTAKFRTLEPWHCVAGAADGARREIQKSARRRTANSAEGSRA